VDDTTDHLTPLPVVPQSRATESPLGRNEVELEIAGVVDSIQTFDVHLIGVVDVTRIWSNEAADEIFVFGAGLDAVFGFVAGLAVFRSLAGLGGGFFGVVVALGVTLLCKHEISLCIVRTSSSCIFASGVSPKRCREFSASVMQMLVNSCVSGRCQRLNFRDSMSETQCQRLNVRDSMSEIQCQRLNVRDSISESQ
jgi:hypothetical protein